MTEHFATPENENSPPARSARSTHTDEHRLAPSDMWGTGGEIFPIYPAAISSPRRRLYEPEAGRDWRQQRPAEIGTTELESPLVQACDISRC
jgi:hypothetical protein